MHSIAKSQNDFLKTIEQYFEKKWHAFCVAHSLFDNSGMYNDIRLIFYPFKHEKGGMDI